MLHSVWYMLHSVLCYILFEGLVVVVVFLLGGGGGGVVNIPFCFTIGFCITLCFVS